MQFKKANYLLAVFFSVALHALVFVYANNFQFQPIGKPEILKPKKEVIVVEMTVPPPVEVQPEPALKIITTESKPAVTRLIQNDSVVTPLADRQLASLAAPPAPTTEEWTLAGKYTLKNSKRYRYT